MDEVRILTKFRDVPDQRKLKTYEYGGGYRAVRRAIPGMKPGELIDTVKQSGLRGRGGAGFRTGTKWGFIPQDAPVKYLVCNCDESEPGSFKDRLLIESDPHQLVEGIILSSYAIGARLAFIYSRGEFYEGIAKLRAAVREARESGYLGERILGSDYSLEIVVHPGAGAYIAGEETALLNSLEGFRANPRLKPPFPALKGLYGCPTVVNNVETLCNVVHIVNDGVDRFKQFGTQDSPGTKIFQVSGQVRNPGCFEFPMGISLEELLQAAGGMYAGRKFKACYPGGSSCTLLTEKHLGIRMDFESLAAADSALGTASVIVMDDTADMVKVSTRLMEFYQNESCGKCTPCREGTRWVVQVLSRIEAGRGTFSDLQMLLEVCKSMGSNSFCPLAEGAALPTISAIKEFTDEFETYIRKNPNADKLPKMKISYPYL